MTSTPTDLAGHLLVAMPSMVDARFSRSVVFLCAYSEQGAMGLVVNQLVDAVRFPSIIEQLDIKTEIDLSGILVHAGGPVEGSRGFVLHTPDFVKESTLIIDDHFALTATVDILKAMASGTGPRRRVFALGYSVWAPGQLDEEIQNNGWLVAPADVDVVYGADHDRKWLKAMRKIGVDPGLLSSVAGHA